jgi:hypothetical protein
LPSEPPAAREVPVASAVIQVNRAPVLTLWAALVAERLGYPRPAALTLGKAVAGLNAQSKGRRLGIYGAPDAARPAGKGKPPGKARAVPEAVLLLGRAVPVTKTPDGLRATVKGRAESPALVERYLEQKFGAALPDVEAALRALARAYPPRRLADVAFALYERFRPEIPGGVRGWGAKGDLDLARIRALARGAAAGESIE